MVTGVQLPRVYWMPPFVSSRGREALEFAESHGMVADPWQRFVVENMLGIDEFGKWAAYEVGLHMPRQNGKGGVIEIRELFGLFELGERLIIHSAHEFATATEARLRMEQILEGSEELSRKVKSVNRSHGSEGFTLLDGRRLHYRTRTKGGGKGFTCPLLILDEAQILPDSFHGALLPTQSAESMEGNPQVIYTGNAVDQLENEDGVVFSRQRERGIAHDEGMAWFDWSAGDQTPDEVDPRVLGDEQAIAQANPGLGIRISLKHVERERASMDSRKFLVERMGFGDWAVTDASGQQLIPLDDWRALTDTDSSMSDPVCFAFDVAPDRAMSSIAAAGARPDGLLHSEIIDRRGGTGWVVARIMELRERWQPVSIICDAIGPASSLVHQLEEKEVEVTTVTAHEHSNACGLLVDLVSQRGIRHLGQTEMTIALKAAAKRPLGDAWAWSRRTSRVDISPLVASTLALWGASTAVEHEPPMFARL